MNSFNRSSNILFRLANSPALSVKNNLFKYLLALMLFQFFLLLQGNAQCYNTSQWPTGATNAGTGASVTIAGNNYEGEYSQITGIVSGATYNFTISRAQDYITVTVGSPTGTVLDFGQTPVSVITTSSSDLYVHWSRNINCGTGNTNRTTTVQRTAVPPLPTITSLGTSSGCAGASITINGTNFTGITAGSVAIGGTAVSSITSFTSTQIIAVTGSGTSGAVSVTTGGGTAYSAANYTVNSMPALYSVTGGGSYCSGSAGIAINLSGSELSSQYQLYNGASAVGGAVTGTGSAISFGTKTSAGTYTVVATSISGGCTLNMTGSATISINALPQGTLIGNSVCGGGTGQLTFTSSSGASPYSVIYNDATANRTAGSVTSGTAFNTFTNPSSTTNYNLVSITDNNGCVRSSGFTIGTATITVGANPTNRTAIASAANICAGTVTNIQIALSQNGVNYQLRNNSGNINIGSAVAGTAGTINLPAGTLASTTTFNVLATNATTGCSIQITPTVTVTVTAAATVSPGSTVNACQSASPAAIPLSGASIGGGATTGAWSITSGSGTLSSTAQTASPASVSFTPTANYAGTVVLTLTTNAPGACPAVSNTKTINVNASPTATITPSYCIGGGVVRLTCSAQTSYLWSTGATTQFIDVSYAGSYSVTGTNAAGCTATTSFNVAQELVTNGNFSSGNTGFSSLYNYTTAANGLYPEGYYAIGANANYYHNNFFGTDHTSGSGNFMIVNGSPTTQNVWQQTISVTPNTTYYFSAWAISVNAVPPFAQLSFTVNSVQVGSTATLAAGASSTAGPFNWVKFFGTWNSGSNTTAVINIIDLQTAAGGNDFGLDDISFSTLTPVSMTVAPTTNTPVCAGNALNISANLTGGTSPFTFSWTGPSSYISSAQDPVITSATTANTGVYALTVTDAYGCTASASTTAATVNALPTVTAAASVCIGSNITLSPTTGGTWVSSNAAIATVTNGGIVTGVSAGTATFTFTQTSTGCSKTTSSVTINALPAVTAGSSVCIGNTITLSPTTGGTWLSNNAAIATVSNGGIVTSVSAGSSTFTFTQTSTGCSKATSSVTINALPVVAAGSSVCIGSTITLSPTSGGTWMSNSTSKATVSNAGIVTAVSAGNVTFTFTQTATGCSNTTSGVTVNALAIDKTPAATASSICTGTSTNIQIALSQSGVNYQLRNNSSNINIGSLVAGTGGTINFATGTLAATTTFNVLATVTSTGCNVQMVNTVTVTVNPGGQWVGGSSGDWNTASNWCGGLPTSSTNVIIPAGSTVNIQTASATANNVTVALGGSLVMGGSYNLNITGGGSFTNNGSFNASSSTGTVAFLGNGTISGTTTFKNIDTYGALNFGTASTISGTFSLQTGGSVAANPPAYTCPSAVLLYKPGTVFTRGLEWTTASSGAGYPANVLVQNNTTVNFPAAGNGFVCYDVQIDAGSSLLQNYGGTSASLNVGRNITINGTLELGASTGGDINLGGNWTRNTGGTFIANDRKVTFDGTGNFSGNGLSMSTISAPASVAKDNEGGFGGEKFAHIWINKTNVTDSVVLLSNITVTRELGFTKGTFSLRNSDVTLVSNSTRTADIAPVATPANISIRYAGTGKFVVQRFIQNPTATRSWRLLTAPLQSATAPSINAAFMAGVVNPDKNTPNGSGGIYNPWPGYGTHITGPGGAYSAANGFDQGTTSSSILYGTSGVLSWLTPTSTLSTKVTDQQGWMLFVRGDRSFVIGNQYMPSANTILEPKGRINVGNISVPVTAGRQVIGNPYPSAISLLNVDVSGVLGKLSSYHVWDPKMFTSFTQPGKWVSFSGLGNTFVQTTSASSYLTNGTIESGQAFLMDVVTPGTITFHESDKLPLTSSLVGIANGTGARPLENPVFPIFRSDIYAKIDNAYSLTDGVLNVFNSAFNNAATDEDAKKIISFNTKESLSILRDSVKIAIEKRSDIKDSDTIFFAISKFNELPYRFRFEATDFKPGYEAFLEDKFTGDRLQLSTVGVSEIDFAITANPLSKAEDRFRVVLKSPVQTVLPVTITSVKAWQQNKKIAVQWKVANEINIRDYEVQKSVDGTHFTKVNTTQSQGGFAGNFIYNWLDENAVEGDNFYRIKSNGYNEKSGYSELVKVRITNSSGSINVYPNPVADGVIRLYFNNMAKGNYSLRLLNATGQTMNRTTFSNEGTVQKKEIQIAKGVAKGIYEIEVIHPGNIKSFVKVIVE